MVALSVSILTKLKRFTQWIAYYPCDSKGIAIGR